MNDETGSLFAALSEFECVEAIALGGSRAGETYDAKSDYDVYVYCKIDRLPEKARRALLSRYCTRMEIGNHFWEYEDNCVLNNGVDIDILYRDLDEFAAGIANVVDKYNASNGYTTCMWHNLRTCKILYDRDGRLSALQKRYECAYPTALKNNIIDRNMRLLRYGLPAYETQIAKAVGRGDTVSVNHRVTEFLASYFDIIFAVNELTHPGEKRLVSLCERNCRLLPNNFRQNIETLFSDMFAEPKRVAADIDAIIVELEKILPDRRGAETAE